MDKRYEQALDKRKYQNGSEQELSKIIYQENGAKNHDDIP